MQSVATERSCPSSFWSLVGILPMRIADPNRQSESTISVPNELHQLHQAAAGFPQRCQVPASFVFQLFPPPPAFRDPQQTGVGQFTTSGVFLYTLAGLFGAALDV